MKKKMLKQISRISYEKYLENKELGVEEIYSLIKYNFSGKSGLELSELCKKMGISELEMKLAILDGIKATSIDSLA
jgi:hypothetical protein